MGGWGSGPGWGDVGLGGQGRCEQRSEVFVKIKKKCGGGGVGSGGGGGWGGSGWGVRVDVNEELRFCENSKNKKILGGGRGESGWWSQDGCEQRIEVFMKIQMKKKFGG